MSSDEDEFLLLSYLHNRKKKRQLKRKYWVHPYIKKNSSKRLFVAADELAEDDGKFHSFYRMTKNTFKELVAIVKPLIQKKDTNMRECISPEERIMITLRYLATGCTFTALGLYFQRGETTIGLIIQETTKAIWNSMKGPYMPLPNKEKWEEISKRFSEIWQLPNCLGAIDGKHIRIQKYPNSGSANFNYKNFHSVILLGCCDADGLFTTIECGFAGRNSDGGIFRISTFGHWLENNNNLPSFAKLPYDESGNEFPHYFVADSAFPLRKNIMRPYPERNMDNKMRIFNYRLSRGRKTIECTFGMMTQKFQVLLTPIRCRSYETIISIIQSVCVLHNFIRLKDGQQYSAYENSRNQQHQHQHQPQAENLNINENSLAQSLRNYLANYFLFPNSALPWQWNYCA